MKNQISALQSQLDDAKTLSTQLRTSNKTLREELRKVQSSVQLMERTRNPGVGYWSSNATAGASGTGGSGGPPNSKSSIRSGITSPTSESVSAMATPTKEKDLGKSLENLDRGKPVAPSGTSSPAPSDVNKDEEEVNLEVSLKLGG
jgi:hypothetical protein